MTNYSEQVQKLLGGMDEQQSNQQQDIQDVYVLIVREQEAPDDMQVVDSVPAVPAQPAPVTSQQDSYFSAYLFVCFSLLLIFATLLFQCYCITNPLVATVTIIPTSEQLTLSGTMQLGRVLPPLTISQSQTTKAQQQQRDISPSIMASSPNNSLQAARSILAVTE